MNRTDRHTVRRDLTHYHNTAFAGGKYISDSKVANIYKAT